jgi:hypothetical protein
MPTREIAISRDVRDELVDEDRDGSHMVVRDVDAEVDTLSRSASTRNEDLDAVGHACDERRPLRGRDEIAAVRAREQDRGLREPAGERGAIRRGERSNSLVLEEEAAEGDLEPAHPPGIACRTHVRGESRDALWRRVGCGARWDELSAVHLAYEPAREDVLARHRSIAAQTELACHATMVAQPEPVSEVP